MNHQRLFQLLVIACLVWWEGGCTCGGDPATREAWSKPAASTAGLADEGSDAVDAPAEGVLRWKKLQVPGALPPKVDVAGSWAIDAMTGNLLVFGGYSFGPGASPAGFKDEMWQLAFEPEPAWTKLPMAGLGPVARVGHVLVDSPRRRLILFGGGTWKLWPVRTLGDLWAYDLDAKQGFVPLRAPEPRPDPRADAQFVLLPKHGRAVFHGGVGKAHTVLGDTWMLELAADVPGWRRVAGQTEGIGRRTFAFHYYDAKRDAFVIVAGMRCYAPSCKNPGPLDAWALRNLSQPGNEVWVQLALQSELPGSSVGRACAYDPKWDQAVCQGLWHYYDWPASDSVVELPQTWTIRMEGERSIRMTRLDVGGTEPPLTQVDVQYDAAGDRFLSFGGWVQGAATQNDVWVLERQSAGEPPCISQPDGGEVTQ